MTGKAKTVENREKTAKTSRRNILEMRVGYRSEKVV